MADADEVMRAIYTALSNEIVRETIRTQLQSIPRPMLLKVLGVNAKRLRHFMQGGDPGRQLWDAAAAFEEGMKEPTEVSLEWVALNIIADQFPDYRRARIRSALADAVRPILNAEGAGCPLPDVGRKAE